MRLAVIPALSSVVLLGCLIAACQILPVLSYSKFSHRQNTPTAEGYAAYVAGSLKPFELATLAYPMALGNPRTPLDAGGLTISQYWPLLPGVKQGANFTESAVNVGPLILVGLFLVPWRRRELWPIAVLGGIALLMALGTALNMPLYYLVPGWSAGGSPGRVIVLFVLCACVLGGIGLGEAVQGLGKSGWIKAGCGLAVGILLAFVGPSMAPASAGSADAVQQIQTTAGSALIPSLVAGLVLALIGVICLGQTPFAKYRPIAVLLPPLLCWVGYGSNLIMTGKSLDPITGVAAQQRVAFLNSDWEIPVAAQAIAPPNTASLSRIHELGGYDSLLHRNTDALIHDIDGKDPAPPANGNMMFVSPSANPGKLVAAGVTAIWLANADKPQPMAGLGRCSVASGTCKITDEGYDHVTVEAEGGGVLTLRDRMMPGWEVSIDGKAVEIPDGMWRTADLGATGHHVVQFRYRPPGLQIGMILSLGGLLAFGLLGWSGLRNRPPKDR